MHTNHYILMVCGMVVSAYGLDMALDFHGGGFIGKYLNSDTTRYNMDASINIYCTIVRHGAATFYAHYQDDLDMAEQTGGVSLDPRYAHYYITGGFDYTFSTVFTALYFVHDCVHDIDYDVEGTPVFNRFRVQCADADIHPRCRYVTDDRFLWSIELGLYPHWRYHGWDINAGADYRYEMIAELAWEWYRKGTIGSALHPRMHITRGESTWYHQHAASIEVYYASGGKRIGTEIMYNIWNNDPIKDPDKLWLLSLFVAF
jgi:hypothetical protein